MKKLNQIVAITALALWAGTPASQAVGLVYEGYNYAIADGASFNGVATTATGLGGNYAVNNTTVDSSSTYAATGGLSFSNFFASTGGALNQSIINNAGTNSTFMGAAFSTGTVTGTVYTSYLVNFTVLSAGNAIQQTRISDSATSSVNARLLTLTDAGGAVGVRTNGVSYGTTPGTTVNGTENITIQGTTYLAVSKFTNVGVAGGGTATTWLLDQAGYDSWLASGSVNESTLATFSLTGSNLTNTSAQTATFSNAKFLNIALSNSTVGAETAILDELRYGTTLGDVINMTPISVPEPSTYALMLGGLLLFWVVRRKRSLV